MMIRICLLSVVCLSFFNSITCMCKCSETERPYQDLTYGQQSHLLKMEIAILDRKIRLKAIDSQCLVNKTTTERIDKLKSTIKLLSTELSKTKNIINSLQTDVKKLLGRSKEKCQSGVFGLHGSNPSWPAKKVIHFSPPFSSIPSIVHGFTVFDSSKSTNIRATVTASSVTKTRFTLTIGKWGDTKQYGLKVRWMACL